MKKNIYLLIVFAMLSLTTAKAQQANIYAYELKASVVADNGDVQFTYTLNADALSVTIDVSNGESFELTETDDLTKGFHTVTKTLANPPEKDEEYTWSVTAVGADPPETPTMITSLIEKFTFVTPRSIAIDNNADSPYFGNVYVLNAYTGASDNGTTDQRNQTQKGIYIFNPLLERQNPVGETLPPTIFAYGSGVSWGTSFDAPHSVSVAPDGKVYIANGLASPAGSIWCLDPENLSSNLVPVFSEGQGITPYCWVTGTGENTKIYTTKISAAITSTAVADYPLRMEFSVYDIGATIPSNAAPVKIFANNTLINNGVNRFVPGQDGGWWITQGSRTAAGSTWSGSNPRTSASLIYIAANGTVVYNSVNDPGVHPYFDTMGTGSVGSIAVSPDGKFIAVASFRAYQLIQVFSIEYDTDGNPALTFEYSFNNGSGGATGVGTVLADYVGLAFDWANNLYTGDAAGEWLRVWATPKTSNIATTPAPAAQVLKIDPASGVKNIAGIGNVRVVCLGNQITVTSGSAIKSVKLYDLQGRILVSKNVSAKNCTLSAPAKGIYIIETITANGRDIQKILT